MSMLSLRWLTVAVDVSLKVVILAVVTGLILRIFKIRSSTLQHAAWLGVLGSLFALPLMSPFLPAIPIPLPLDPHLEWTPPATLTQSVTTELSPSERPIPSAPVDVPELSPWIGGQPRPPLQDTRLAAEEPQFSFPPSDQLGSSPSPIPQPLPAVEDPSVDARPLASSPWMLRYWPVVILWVWGLGTLVLAARLVYAVLLTTDLIRRSKPIARQDHILAESRDLLQEPSSPQVLPLRESSDIRVPLTTGLWQPVVLLPTDWHFWTQEKLDHVLVHEWTHIQRRDCFTAFVVNLATCLYWFHPLTWWLQYRLNTLAEECCDDAAIAASGNRTGYARHLLEIASVMSGERSRLVYSGFSMARRSGVESRINAILDFDRPLARRLTGPASLLLVALIVPLIAVAAALRPAQFEAAAHEQQASDVNTGDSNSATDPGPGRDSDGDAGLPFAQTDSPSSGSTSSTISRTTKELEVNDTPRSGDIDSFRAIRVQGRVTNPAGQPVAAAFVALVGTRMTILQGMIHETLGEGVTDEHGDFDLHLNHDPSVDIKHERLIVRSPGYALSWRSVDLSTDHVRNDLSLQPEQSIQVRLIDIEGQPAAGVQLEFKGIVSRDGKGDFYAQPQQQPLPQTALPVLTADGQGFITIPYIPPDYGIHLQSVASEKFAPHLISLNMGIPETRQPTDGTYRGLVKNIRPGEVGTLALAPARFFEGVVRLGTTGQPAAHARISIWSSDQEPWGSMVDIDGTTDEAGRFRLNPFPGVRFGLRAYPPTGSSYQIRKLEDLKWEPGDAVRRIEIQLPPGVLSRGTVLDAVTGQPLVGATVQYYPNEATNKHLSPDLITGWQSLRETDHDGNFEIPVAPGPGTLLIHAPIGTSYLLEERGSREISRGWLGGIRNYAHAFHKIDPPVPVDDGDTKTRDASARHVIKLQPGGTVSARLVDSTGKPVLQAKTTSRLRIFPTNPFWRAFPEEVKNGFATFRGLKPGVKYPVYILNTEQEIGAVTEISLDDPHPTIVLQPCATATADFVDAQGQPIKPGQMRLLSMVVTPGPSRMSSNPLMRNLLAADEDFDVNFTEQRSNTELVTDDKGRLRYRLLVPGGTYRMNNQGGIELEFIAKTGHEHDLGTIVIDADADQKQTRKTTTAQPPAKEPATATAQVDATTAAPPSVETQEPAYQGHVTNTEGKPVPGAEIWLAVSADRDDDPPESNILRKVAAADANGDFAFRIPLQGEKTASLLATESAYRTMLVARSPDHGFDWLPLVAFEQQPVANEQRTQLQTQIDSGMGKGRFASQTLILPHSAGTVRGRLVDLEGRPLKNVAVQVEALSNPDVSRMNEAFTKSSADLMSQALYASHISWAPINRQNWQKLIPRVTTDSNGDFTLQGLGRDQLATVTIDAKHVTSERFFVLGKEMETKSLPHLPFYPDGAKLRYHGLKFVQAVGPAATVSGVVTEYQSGKPIERAIVLVERLFGDVTAGAAVQLRMDTQHIRAITDEQGRYELHGIPAGAGHVLQIIPPKSEPWLIAKQTLSISPESNTATSNIQVYRGIWMEGRVTDAQSGEPIPGSVDYLALATNSYTPQSVGLQEDWQMERFPLSHDGRYRTAGLPGPGLLLVRSFGKKIYPRSVGAADVEGYDAQSNFIPTSPIGMPLANWHLVQFVDPAQDAVSHQLDLTLSAGTDVPGRVVVPDGAEVPSIEVMGQVEKNAFFELLSDNTFKVHNYDPAVPRSLFFKSKDASLVAALHLEGSAPADVIVSLQPSVTARGRLIETETDRPAVGYSFYCTSSKQGPFRIEEVFTNDEGQFEFKGLLAGNSYQISSINPQRFDNGKNHFTIDLTNAQPGEVAELGDVTGKNARKK